MKSLVLLGALALAAGIGEVAVTNRTARAMHHTGQRPPTGQSARDRAGTGAGSDSGAGVAAGTAGTAGTRDRSSPPGVPGAVAA